MNSSKSTNEHDQLSQYTSSVQGLHLKLALVVAKQKDVANSLGRAAAALRSISALNPPKTALGFEKRYSFSQENSSGSSSFSS